ncbi:hypothetical protein RvY_05097 [Ramazzottius varieornatus]|uniref:Uncharacterized protein n=1 Tax=Ramazzottius varieornatus TaxID=947166 RepID=A0A1D1UWZ1_RAMVA|nr:hypothetical protein RvY_05097 [Ramazzottius varieornatus]
MMSPARTSVDSFGTAVHAYLPHIVRNVVYSDFAVRRVHPFLSTIGAVALTYYSARALYRMGKSVTKYLLTAPLNLGADLRKSGEWAVITGGSDGIGKEYAFQLAHKGLNIVLIARSLEKLEGLAREITAKYNVQTKIIAIDLSKMGHQNVPQMQDELKDLDIAVLVNCAGVLGSGGRFLETPPTDEDAAQMVNLNNRSLVMMTRAIMPMMLNRKTKESKYIINVGGLLGGHMPAAGYALYGATRAFTDSFSRALHVEYSESGISVQSLLPGATQTNMVAEQIQKYAVPTADVVSSSLAQLGWSSRTFGHWRHAFSATRRSLLNDVLNLTRAPRRGEKAVKA